jgi:hypothetical protein
MKHGTPVETFTGICFRCHREQLDAAQRGSYEWELPPITEGNQRPDSELVRDRPRTVDQEQLDLEDELAATEGLDPWIRELPVPPWRDDDDQDTAA